MKDTIKLGIVLLIFTAVSAGVLAVTNNITEPIIAEYERALSFEAFSDMFQDADDFQELDEEKLNEIKADYTNIVEIHEAIKGNDTIGYAIKVISGGYGGNMTIIAGINNGGDYAGVKVVDQSETPNLGDKILEESFTSTFIGKTIAEALKAVASPSAENEVLLLSGATVSTGAVVTGVNRAREAYIAYLSDGSIELPEDEDPFEALFADAEEFNEIDSALLGEVTGAHEDVKAVHEATLGGELIGYVFTSEAKGYNKDVAINVYTGIDLDGKLTGMRIGENGETPGLGTMIEEEDFTSLFVGKSASEELKAVASASSENEIDIISNATVSSKGAVSGVNKAIKAYLEFFSN